MNNKYYICSSAYNLDDVRFLRHKRHAYVETSVYKYFGLRLSARM